MFGTYQFGTYEFGTSPLVTEETVTGRVVYNGLSLDKSTVRVSKMSNLDDLPEYSRETYKTSRVHGEGNISFLYDRKTIVVEGIIKASSASELETEIKTIKQKLAVDNKQLRIERDNGDKMTTTATVTELRVPRDYYHLTFVPFTVAFTTIDPFFLDIVEYEEPFEGKSANFSDTVDNVYGNYKAEPVVFINFSTGLSSVTTITITIGDDVLTVTGTYTDNDIVKISTVDRDVFLNDTGGEEFSGSFGELEIGENDIQVAIDGTWSADIYFQRYPRYV